MYCSDCGKKNRENASFCKKCGAELEPEDETVVATRGDSEPEAEIEVFSINPTLLFVRMGYILAVLVAFLLVALLATIGRDFGIIISSGIVVLLGVAMLLVPAVYHIRQRSVTYTLTDAKVEIDEGIITKTTRNVPLRIIQDVTVSATLPQRMLGLGDIEIENANENDEVIILRNIDSPRQYADVLLNQMRLLEKR